MDVQVLRSVGQWSAGTPVETSIHAAYCSAIKNAHRFVYIEVRAAHVLGCELVVVVVTR